MDGKHDIVIVGTGMSGICCAIKLKEAGIHKFVLLERDSAVGGTWRDNTYPGAACDVESHLYSFSFEQNPEWGYQYSKQAEILSYLKHCVLKYKLSQHIVFNSNVVCSKYIEDEATWVTTLQSGEQYKSKVVIRLV